MKKTGQFDIIKIISIFMILILHYLNKGMGGGMSDTISFNGIITHTLESICIIGCNLFVLITSWFMIDAKKIKLKKIIDIVIIIIFYALAIYVVCLCSKIITINKESIKIFINTIGNCWFIIIYIILYILIPFINKSLNTLNKKEVLNLMIIMLFFFSLWPTFFTDVTIKDGGYGIINFITLYIITYYIKKYTNYSSFKSYILLLLFILGTISTTLYSFKAGRAWNYNSIFVILSSITLFMLFTKINISRNKTLSYISGFSLAIYIIHSNEFISKRIYQDIFNSYYYSHTNMLIINLFISIILIFVGCIIIEIVKRFIFKYTLDKLINKTKIYNKEIQII